MPRVSPTETSSLLHYMSVVTLTIVCLFLDDDRDIQGLLRKFDRITPQLLGQPVEMIYKVASIHDDLMVLLNCNTGTTEARHKKDRSSQLDQVA